MRKLSLSAALAVAFGLCTAPSAHAGPCTGGDPVYDPGSNSPCNFAMAPATTGAEAIVHGRYFGRTPVVYQPSYVKDTADDGLDAYLWVRYVRGDTTTEKPIEHASGLGATTTVSAFLEDADAFYLRVCVGPDASNCSAWLG